MKMDTSEIISRSIDTRKAEPVRKGIIAAYIAVSLLYWIGLYLYMPTLSVYVQSKVNSLATVGTILSMFGLWEIVTRLPTGIAADFLGRRKPFIMIGLLFVGAGAWTLGASDTAPGLLAGRSLTGVAAATWVPLIASFAALFKPHEAIRATAILTLVGTVGRIVATALTGWINTASGGYHLAFQLAAGVAWVGAIAILLLPETAARGGERMTGRSVLRLMARRDVLLPALLNAVIQYGDWTATFTFIPILAQRLGAGDVIQSPLISMNLAIVLVGNLIAASLVNRFGIRKLVLASLILMACGIGAAAWITSISLLFVSQGLVGLSIGIGYPVMLGSSIAHVEDKERTVASGLHQSVYAIGMFAGPWMSGIIANTLGISPMFAITGVAILVFGLTLSSLLRPNATGRATQPEQGEVSNENSS